MSDAPAPARLSFKTLFGLACLTAFLASLAGPGLFVAGAALVESGTGGSGMAGLLPFALIAFLFTFPIGLAVLLLVGPLAARRKPAFIRDHRGAAALIGLVAGAALGMATALLLFGGNGLLAASGALSGACYGAIWMWLCAWQLDGEVPHG
ncbi:MAG TPA: hypothetical protein VNS79_05130 [Sphingobium sp.]|nr:hypothetical protein [Sphingobium sp.]